MIFFKSADRGNQGLSRIKGVNPSDGTSFVFTIQRSVDSPHRIRVEVRLFDKLVSKYCHYDAISFAQAIWDKWHNVILGDWIRVAYKEIDNISGYGDTPDTD